MQCECNVLFVQYLVVHDGMDFTSEVVTAANITLLLPDQLQNLARGDSLQLTL